uniref:Phosphatase PP2A regulatory subunit A/Splicing factor 3B subunit 1-like HEAT repeat domain-containing protein n=1 Tax=Hemiselmis andersenii TaxID=464988 RepID=A0A6U2FNL7_HEMAN|mmetsp:Transcript_33019/g.77216  ORF Transcript_33019/g.77216 Transcript_33019/m.77216 type:complete len:589 (-) Transcript_33019:122-1888(-)
MAGQVDAYGLLVEEFKSDDVTEQLAAAKRINTIAINMGPDRSRSQLLPFLRSCVDEYTDEVLMTIAEAAGGMVQSVGGGDVAHSLLPLLEALAEQEETVVRAKAVDSLVLVGKAMPGPLIQEHFAPLVKRLAGGEFFTTRISAAGLFASIYPSTPVPTRPQLRKQYEQLAKDDMPMVRSAAFAHMPVLAEVMEKEVVVSEVAPLFNDLSSDLQESVREMAVGIVVQMVKLVSPDEAARLFGAFFDNIQTERSFTMRLQKARNFVPIAEAMHPARNIRDQVQAFLQLMAIDTEVEVRVAISKSLGDLCKLLDGPTILAQILPVVRELCQATADPNQQIMHQTNYELRENIANNICSVATVLGRESTSNDLLPLIKLFFSDESIEIRRKVLFTIAPVVETLGSETVLTSLLPDVVSMAVDQQWRVRLPVVQTLDVYGKHMGMEVFNARLLDFQLKGMSDQIAHIRECAVANLGPLTRLFGEDWITDNILPHILDLSKAQGPSGFHSRLVALQSVAALASCASNTLISQVLVPQVATPLHKDKVVNVRIACAEALVRCQAKVGDAMPEIAQLLSTLASDSDRDVQFAASAK